MSTVTAINPRPYVFTRKHVNVELVLAKPEDIKKTLFIANEHITRLRYGMVYWLFSPLKKEMESTPRFIDIHDDPNDFKTWLEHNMIYIAKNQFE